MEFEQKFYAVLPENGYSIELKTINNIRFTDREIDIMACLLGGKVSKKIASFLFISNKTVEGHLHNIMLKLGCNSRQKIINFIEKSDNDLLVKKHYSDLLIKIAFEKELKNITILTNNISCIIFYYKTQRAKDPFVSQLEKHLNIAGIKASSKVWEKGKSISWVLNSTKTNAVDFVIYSMSTKFTAQLQIANYDLTLEVSDMKLLLKKTTDPIVFLLLDKPDVTDIKNYLLDFVHLDFTNPNNYYLLVFELLKKLLLYKNIDKNIAGFKKQYELFYEHAFLQKSTKKLMPDFSRNKNHICSKKPCLKIVLFLLLIICTITFSASKTLYFLTKNNPLVAENTTNNQNNFYFLKDLNNKIRQKFASTKENGYSEKSTKIQDDLMTEKAISSGYTKDGTSKMILLNLPPRNNNFTGRRVALKQIETQLNKHKFGIITQTIAGLGGVGKTQLVTEFAYKAAEQNIYKTILWVTAETPNAITNAYKEFANILQIDIKGLNSREVQVPVHRKLVEIHEDSKILFVLDNVPNYDDIQNYIMALNKQFPANIPLHILITSRSQHWPEHPLMLNAFTSTEALIFVKKHLPNEEKHSMLSLTKTLHYFPLALGQATAYIKAHTNINDYLTLYSTKKKDYLNKFPGDKNQYTESLWKTWDIALDKLSGSAKEILFMSAYLYPDKIPIEFFDNLSLEQRGNAIEELRRYSFIIVTNNNKSFKMHRLLQEVIRTAISIGSNNFTIKKKFNGLTNAIDLLEAKCNFGYTQVNKWGLCSQYLTHAQSLADHTLHSNSKLRHTGIQLYSQVAMYSTYVQEDIKNARQIWEKILNLVKQNYNKDDSFKLVLANIYTHLSFVMDLMGHMESANQYAKKAISIYNSKLPVISTNAEKLLTYLRWGQNITALNGIKLDQSFAFNALGNVEADLADFKAAEISFKKALEILNDCKPKTPTLIYKIAFLQNLISLYVNVVELQEATNAINSLKLIVDEHYPNHPQIFVPERMADLLYYMGNHNEAKEILDKCFKTRLSIYSNEHYRIGYIKAKQGLILCASGHINNSIAVLKQAETIYIKNFDEGHINFIPLFLYLSYAFEMHKELDQSLQYLIKAQKIAKESLGDKTCVFLSHQLSPIEKFPSLNKSEKNIAYYTQILKLTKQMFGMEHIRVARYHYLLGQIFENVHDKNKAKSHYQIALNIASKQSFNNKTLSQGNRANIDLLQGHLAKL